MKLNNNKLTVTDCVHVLIYSTEFYCLTLVHLNLHHVLHPHLKLWIPCSSCCSTSLVVEMSSSAPTNSEVESSSCTVGCV